MGLVFPKEDPDAEYLKTQGWTHKGPQLQDVETQVRRSPQTQRMECD